METKRMSNVTILLTKVVVAPAEMIKSIQLLLLLLLLLQIEMIMSIIKELL